MASTSWFRKNRSPDNDEEPDRAYNFTYKELKKATGNFSIRLGGGGYGDVYEGKLQNKQTVAVKVLKERTPKSLEQFDNEVELLSRLHHQNLVVFYGSTKSHKELLLVYEFVSNNTLRHHLHDEQLRFILPLRIRIAVQIAEGLSYLHSANPSVIHRDVKTDNILLDHAFDVKIADFGLSRLLFTDETDITTNTHSTQGYEDPEYKKGLTFTLKSDVYSFGVVLVELISRKKAVDIQRGRGNIFLDEIAPNIIMNKKLEQLVDPYIGYHSNDDATRVIDSVAELALKCLQPTGEMRPPMVEVLRVLKEIYYEMQQLPIFQEMISELAQAGQKEFKIRLYGYKELKKATNSFHPSRRIAEGAYCDTYIGKFPNGQNLAVKMVKYRTVKTVEQFNNEARLLSRLHHQNLAVFYGCTKPLKHLLLVYELVPYNTLNYHLHDEQLPFVLPLRIQIAIQIAEGLSYLHSANPPVIHGDVKTDKVLLDLAINVKIVGFGLSQLLSADETGITTTTGSTPGYEDPEYKHCLKFTLKSDVYSFGVVLVELISRKKAVDVHRGRGNIFLDKIASNIIKNKELEQLVDPDIGYHSNDDARRIIDSVAELALKCLQPTGEMRPPMFEVLRVLKEIYDEMQHLPIFQEMISEIALAGQKELNKATDSFHRSLSAQLRRLLEKIELW